MYVLAALLVFFVLGFHEKIFKPAKADNHIRNFLRNQIAYVYSVIACLTRILFSDYLGPILCDFEIHKFELDRDRSLDRKRNCVIFFSGVLPFVMTILKIVSTNLPREDGSQLMVTQLRAWMATHVVFTALDVVNPLVKQYYYKCNEGRHGADLNQFAREFFMPDYTGSKVSSDYSQVLQPMMIMNLFGIVDPIVSPLLFLLLVFVNIVMDIQKLLRFYKRPIATKDKGLGKFRFAALRWSIWLGFLVKSYLLVFGTVWGYPKATPIQNPLNTTFPHAGGMNYQAITINLFCILLFADQVIGSIVPDTTLFTHILKERVEWQQQKLSQLSRYDDDFTPPCLSTEQIRQFLGTTFDGFENC